MSAFTTADTLHRLVKQALDSGEAVSIAEAEALLAGYRLALRLDDAQARDSHHQAVLLTAVALARRVFLGGVTVAAAGGLPLLTPLPFGRTLGEAVVALGATLASLPDGFLSSMSAAVRSRAKAISISGRCSRAGAAGLCPPMLTHRLRRVLSWRSRRCSPPRSRSTKRSCSSPPQPGLRGAGRWACPCGTRHPPATGSARKPTSLG